MTSIWQKIIVGFLVVLLAWFMSLFRFDIFTGSDGIALEARQEQRTKDSEARIVKAIDELKEALRDHSH